MAPRAPKAREVKVLYPKWRQSCSKRYPNGDLKGDIQVSLWRASKVTPRTVVSLWRASKFSPRKVAPRAPKAREVKVLYPKWRQSCSKRYPNGDLKGDIQVSLWRASKLTPRTVVSLWRPSKVTPRTWPRHRGAASKSESCFGICLA